MNFPYLEHRVISVHLTQDNLYWVELSQMGKRIHLVSKGELAWKQYSEDTLETLRDSIKADVFHVTLSAPDLVIDIRSEEIPYSEDPEEVNRWVSQRQTAIAKEFGEHVEVHVHITQVEEEVQRALFQIVNTNKKIKLELLFEEVGLPLSDVYTGITEFGYSQVLDPDLVDGVYSVWFVTQGVGYLLHYKQGMIQQYHRLQDVEEGIPSEPLFGQVNALIRSEELVHQEEQGSTTLYVHSLEHGKDIGQRSVRTIVPYDGKASFENVPAEYVEALGAGIKSLYPSLDSFNVVSTTSQVHARKFVDKQSFFKISVLLLVPLFIFGLAGYAWNAGVEYKLVETRQVLSAIEDKLDRVQSIRADVQALFNEYQRMEGVTTTQTNTAKVFTALNETINNDIFMNKVVLKSSNDSSVATTQVSGIAKKELAISTFMQAISEHKWTAEPQLLSSKVEQNRTSIEFIIEVKLNTQ